MHSAPWKKNQNSKTAGVYAVSDIGYDASDMWDNSTLSGNVTVNSGRKVYVEPSPYPEIR